MRLYFMCSNCKKRLEFLPQSRVVCPQCGAENLPRFDCERDERDFTEQDRRLENFYCGGL